MKLKIKWNAIAIQIEVKWKEIVLLTGLSHYIYPYILYIGIKA